MFNRHANLGHLFNIENVVKTQALKLEQLTKKSETLNKIILKHPLTYLFDHVIFTFLISHTQEGSFCIIQNIYASFHRTQKYVSESKTIFDVFPTVFPKIEDRK